MSLFKTLKMFISAFFPNDWSSSLTENQSRTSSLEESKARMNLEKGLRQDTANRKYICILRKIIYIFYNKDFFPEDFGYPV